MSYMQISVHDPDDPPWADKPPITHHATTDGAIEVVIIPDGCTSGASAALRADFDDGTAVVFELTGSNVEAMSGGIRGVNDRDQNDPNNSIALRAVIDGTASIVIMPAGLDLLLRRIADGDGIADDDDLRNTAKGYTAFNQGAS